MSSAGQKCEESHFTANEDQSRKQPVCVKDAIREHRARTAAAKCLYEVSDILFMSQHASAFTAKRMDGFNRPSERRESEPVTVELHC